jgi:hypothetical protein
MVLGTESEERAKFFSTKTEGLTDQKIQIQNRDADPRTDVADRIYKDLTSNKLNEMNVRINEIGLFRER